MTAPSGRFYARNLPLSPELEKNPQKFWGVTNRKSELEYARDDVCFGPLADVEHPATLLVEVVHLALALAPAAWRNGSRRAH